MESIHFFSEDSEYKVKGKTLIRDWLKSVARDYNKKISSLNIIFTTDDYLIEMNQKFLNHDTYTDIITFDQSNDANHIEADIYISVDRVVENAKSLAKSIEEEMHRVIVHGVLHLVGYKDKTLADKEEMRKKENHYLALRLESK
jgi:rRNA maturation RNase YbeY